MPLRTRSARKATGADAAHSRMSLSLPSWQEDRDGALKLVNKSTFTNAQAQWPKTGTERQRRILVGVICSQQMKISPLRGFFQRLTTRYAERTAALSVQPIRGNFAQVTLGDSTNRYCVCMLRCRFQYVWTSVWFMVEFKSDLWDFTGMSVSSLASKVNLAAETEDNSWRSSPKHSWTEEEPRLRQGSLFFFFFFLMKLTLLDPKLSHAGFSQKGTE